MSAIRSDPDVLGGTPCFAGTRVPVSSMFDYLRRGYSIDQFVEQFPTVKREQAQDVIDLAKIGLNESSRRASK